MIEIFDKTFSFAEFEVDTARRRLLKNGEPVALNPKAFDLLLTLIENRGQLLSKEELLETVWANQFVEENNLTVHISALRKVLGERKNEHRFIVTVPGKGYNFVAKVQSVGCEETELPQNGEKSPREISQLDGNINKSVVTTNEQNNLLRASTENFDERESLVGREREIAEIKNLLRGDTSNLITLTGTGGTGKTSLARAIADDLTADFPDGVFFVELAAVTDAKLLIPAIAHRFSVKESGGASLADNLKNYLRERRLLLILDNFEQLISAAALLSDLAATSPLLKVLVTSRAALRIKNEREFVVMPLAVPPRNAAIQIDQLEGYSAVALFIRRAQAAKSSFTLTEKNAPVVAEICHKLDGLPLAIELAAARIKLLAPQSILDRLENSLKLLKGGAKDLPLRQRTMRGAIEWSYELLDAEQKILFRNLAVFAGGFRVEAAEAVSDSDLPVLDLLTSLIDDNLLAQIELANGNVRLRMLEVVSEFALEQLQASGEIDRLRENHARYFLALAEEAEPHLTADQSIVWLSKLETDIDNLRAALLWLSKKDSGAMTRLVIAARYYWINKSLLTEGIEWLNAALERAGDAPTSQRFKLLGGLGSLKRLQGDYAATAEYYGRGLAEGEATGDRRQIALANSGLGTALFLKGDTEAARKSYEKGLAISSELKDDFGIAAALKCLGVMAMVNLETVTARQLLEESLAIFRRLGNKEAVSNSLNLLGAIAIKEDYLAAQSYFDEGLSLARELGNKINVTDSLNGLAALAAERDEPQRAVCLAGAAENLRESIGYDREIYEQRFCDAYLAKARSVLDEKTFAAAFEQGQNLNFSEAVALACRQPENGSNRKQTNESFSGFDGQSEIIIENRSFSRVIIEEEITEDEIPYKTIESETLKAAENSSGVLPKIIYLSIGAALLVSLVLTFWFWNSGSSASSNQFNMSKLTTSGKVTNATLTPDSKYAVFSQAETDGESLWLRHIATGSQKQILPANPVRFVGLAVAPDGDTIYATIFSPALPDPQIWRVPLLGGSTEEIKGITTGTAVSFSPDGTKIAFIESRSPINESHLMVSDASVANKRIVLRAKGDVRSLSNFDANPVAWSPGGDEIACAVAEKNGAGAMKAGILLVNPADGSEQFISDRRWDYISHLVWRDAENLAFIANTNDPWQGQIWSISKQTGEATQITKDLNNYAWLGSAGGNLLTVQKNAVSHISISGFDEKNNQFEPREIFKQSGFINYVAFAADGSILYSSSESGKREIWRMNADGTNPAQLTVNANITFGLSVSPVDGSIVFCSTENGKHSLKLTNADGKNMRFLTEGTEDVYPNFTGDGQAIIYQHGLDNKLITLRRVSLKDKNSVQLTKTHATHPAISKDGTQTAYYFMDAETDNLWRVGLVSSETGSYLGKLSFPKAVTERRMRWHPSGKFIGQILYAGENINLLLLPVNGGEPKIVSGLGKGDVNWFEWSPDGKQIVVSHTTETQDVIFLSR